jgi:adenosylmethionine-8-amino-7-oxononanoate aminotransferase
MNQLDSSSGRDWYRGDVGDLDTLRRWDRDVVWHAFSQMADYDGLIVQSAQGCWLNTVDGRRYLDGASSLWCNVHGHAHPKIDAAIIRQLSQVAHVTSLGMSHPTTIKLAKRLVDMAPAGLEHVFFSSDGASAVEVAMKMAFQYWRQCDSPQLDRTTFLAVGNGYHGDTLGACSVSGVSRFQAVFQPLLFPVLRGPCPDSYRIPSEANGALANGALKEYYLDRYEAILRQHASSIAAIIVEPLVQGAAGMIVHPPGFLAGLYELSRKYNTLLIADEVAVGIGRTGKMFACEHESISPDLLCLGKGLTGGYLPMSATLCSSRIHKAFLGSYADGVSFSHGHTYGGNPLAAAAAHATFDVFEDEQTLLKLNSKIQLLSNLLTPIAEHPRVGDVRQVGFLAAIELVLDKVTKQAYPWEDRRGAAVCREALKLGVWLRPLGNIIPIIPPLSISEQELEILVKAIATGIDVATK